MKEGGDSALEGDGAICGGAEEGSPLVFNEGIEEGRAGDWMGYCG